MILVQNVKNENFEEEFTALLKRINLDVSYSSFKDARDGDLDSLLNFQNIRGSQRFLAVDLWTRITGKETLTDRICCILQ